MEGQKVRELWGDESLDPQAVSDLQVDVPSRCWLMSGSWDGTDQVGQWAGEVCPRAPISNVHFERRKSVLDKKLVFFKSHSFPSHPRMVLLERSPPPALATHSGPGTL